MRKRVIQGFYLFIGGILLFYACTAELEPVLNDESLSIGLRWIPGEETLTQEQALIGLTWALSNLGANLPSGSLTSAITWNDHFRFALNFNKLGFERFALSALHRIIKTLKQSEEYEEAGGIDLGRFIMLTINSSYHYYKITGVPETIDEFRSLYKFNGKRLQVIQSSIALNHRLVEIADATEYDEIAHIGGENGSTFGVSNPFEPAEFEVLDLMPNGQLRYGIYGRDGRLRPAADDLLTIGGKVSKCMWCHEVNIQPLFLQNAVLDDGNSLTQEEFTNLRNEQVEWVDSRRQSLNTDLDYSRPQDHEKMEKLYEDFMEPSLERLALEWDMTLLDITDLLNGMPTHFRGMGDEVYHRKDIDGLSPYGVVRVPDYGREKSSYEPNFL